MRIEGRGSRFCLVILLLGHPIHLVGGVRLLHRLPEASDSHRLSAPHYLGTTRDDRLHLKPARSFNRSALVKVVLFGFRTKTNRVSNRKTRIERRVDLRRRLSSRGPNSLWGVAPHPFRLPPNRDLYQAGGVHVRQTLAEILSHRTY